VTVPAGVSAEAFERCMSVGGIALFGSDTVYGLACDVHNRLAVERLYRIKRRRLDKPSAVMFFDLELALGALSELGPRVRLALGRLMPGQVTVLLPNPAGRFALACGDDRSTFGLRVIDIPALRGVRWPVLQSSANLAGEPEARRVDEVPEPIRRAVELIIDGGELPGTASTVVDLRGYEEAGEWRIVRRGAVPEAQVALALEHQFHFDAEGYEAEIREDIPDYDDLQAAVAEGSGEGAQLILELGTGTGETAARLLERHPRAALVGLDESPAMLAEARRRLPAERVTLEVGAIENPLPDGAYDLIASALCVHHVHGLGKRELFSRVHAALRPGGRFVLGDVIAPVDPAAARIPLSEGYDHPSPLADQLRWLGEAGLEAHVAWERGDLAVIVALRRS
jgi:tRNA threonylcarbamoyl adenosine modification protein (Sua5/YciO/YrdC/YwlC family)